MGFFKKKDTLLPCKQTGECPYDYDKDSDRDVEGMPFVEGDSRSCPEYGHICPKFMEDFNLTVEELNIRAVIHCGGLLDYQINKGMTDPNEPEVIALLEKYEEVSKQYPKSEYPQYY